MGLQIRLVGILIVLEGRSLHDVVQHVADVAVDILDLEGAVLDTGDDAVDLILVARFHQVVAGPCGLDRTGLVAPVGHDDTLVAPLVAEDTGEQVVLLLGVLAVELVVGGHDGPGIGLLDGDFEVLEVDLAEGTLADAGIVLVAVGLLVVDGVVLDGDTHVVALYTIDIGSSHLTGEDRILGEVLEVTAAERVTMDVHTRGEEDVHTILVDFFTHGLGHLLDEVDIPGAGEEGSHRETGRIIGVLVVLAGRGDTDTGRAVGEDGSRNAETFDRAGVAGGAGHLGGSTGRDTIHDDGAGAADQQGGLLFQGHRLDNLIDVVLAELGLCEGGQGHHPRGSDQKDFFHTDYGFVLCSVLANLHNHPDYLLAESSRIIIRMFKIPSGCSHQRTWR